MTPFDYIILVMTIFLSRALSPLINLVIAACLGLAVLIARLRL